MKKRNLFLLGTLCALVIGTGVALHFGADTSAASYLDAYNGNFQAYLEANFPESYWASLTALHEAHPNWVFVAQNTGLDWNTVITNEMVFSRNLVPNNSSTPSSWKDTTISGSFDWVNNNWVTISSPNWVQASKAVVEYFMDPRNFLNETDIFQFEQLSYDTELHTLDGVVSILANTFMENTAIVDAEDSSIVDVLGESHTVQKGSVAMGSTDYWFTEDYLYGFEAGTTVQTVLNTIQVEGGSVVVHDASDANKSGTDTLATGDYFILLNTSKQEVGRVRAVLYGDVNGDGKISVTDSTYIRRQLWKISTLSGPYAEAADTTHDGKVSVSDSTYIRRQLWKISSISQSLGNEEESTSETGYLSYAEAFLEIGKELGVSPYMLAARVRQEQGVNGTSALISGTYPGYEGYYNYFNIQATGTTQEEIIINGLNEAVAGGWVTWYKALLGGARKLVNNYISVGQDTLYLQKFDVDDSDGKLYWHQYMQNLQAARNESRTTRSTYVSLGIYESAFVFKIPVYNNMPSTAAEMPSDNRNPNYKLGSIAVNGAAISGFSTDTTTYTVTVPAGSTQVTLAATAYASTSTITGTGTKTLNSGTQDTVLKIVCAAENGTSRTYTITIKKAEASSSEASSSAETTAAEDVSAETPATLPIQTEG